jgi:hypothetical protein
VSTKFFVGLFDEQSKIIMVEIPLTRYKEKVPWQDL